MTATTPDHAVLHQLEDELLKLKCHLSRAVQQWNIKYLFLTVWFALNALSWIEIYKTFNQDIIAMEITDFENSFISKPIFIFSGFFL